jgi:hypothetical protein
MTQQPCPLEGKIVTAARTGVWGAGLRAHAAECDDCAEAMLVAGALWAAGQEMETQPLADSSLIWWKAQIRSRRAAREKMERPLRIFEQVAPLIGLAGAIWGLAWWSGVSPEVGLAAAAGAVLLFAAAGSAYWFAARFR